jgi:hypothetical protein
VVIVLALSAQPGHAMAPVRWLLLAKRRAIASAKAMLRSQTTANG